MGKMAVPLSHLKDIIPDLSCCENPLKRNPAFKNVERFFMSDNDVVNRQVLGSHKVQEDVRYLRGGPRETVYFHAPEVRACIVTCGGLCPGMNTVIREVVMGLWNEFGVREIMGIKGGYRGFYDEKFPHVRLTPAEVDSIHKLGGTILQSTRGGHDTGKIVDAIEKDGFNHVYIIGGDGTMRGALKIHKEIQRRGLKVVVAGIPKTVDNDIPIIDKSFGFDTAVEAAQAAINAANVEALSAPNGVGLVKLMGRFAGHIATEAALASRDVDCCLIPEVSFHLEGPTGLCAFVDKRLKEQGHMVIVVAEGAGQDLILQSEMEQKTDASGNRLLQDIGLWLKTQLTKWYEKTYGEPLSLKYIDPTYMIRAIPANASDQIYCTLLAHNAVHGAMAGYTGFVSGRVNGKYCYIPIEDVTDGTHMVNVNGSTWARMRSINNQPDFSRAPGAVPPTTPGRRASVNLIAEQTERVRRFSITKGQIKDELWSKSNEPADNVPQLDLVH